MVEYAQQTDPAKTKISSIDTAEPQKIMTDSKSDIAGNPVIKQPTQEASQTTPQSISEPQTQLKQANPTPINTGSYYKDVYLPKVQAERERRAATGDVKNIETPAPSRAQTMDVQTLAQAYDLGDVSATDLENLKQTDPLKYQETKLTIDRKRTLDLINKTGQDYVQTTKQLSESYLKQWEDITSSDEGKTLREEVFAKYGLNDSNEKIKNYGNQIDKIDEELEKLTNRTGTGDALSDRSEMIRNTKELTKQRMDMSKLRANEVDFYRLGLEQADVVVKDYKEYKKEEIVQLGVKFEMITGMNQMEFQQRDAQAREHLSFLDKNIEEVNSAIKDNKQEKQDIASNVSLLSLYDGLSIEQKAEMAKLSPKSLENVLKVMDSKIKQEFDSYKYEKEFGLKEKEFGLDMLNYDLDLENMKIKLNEPKFTKGETKDGVPFLYNERNNEITYVPNIDLSGVQGSGATGGQCGKYVNQTLGLYDTGHFGDSIENKKKLMNTNKVNTPIKGAVFIEDTGTANGHVGIVTGVNIDGTINISESNYKGDEKVRNITINPKSRNIAGYYLPPTTNITKIKEGMSPMTYELTKDEKTTFDSTVGVAIDKGDRELALLNLRASYRAKLTADGKKIFDSRAKLAGNVKFLMDEMDSYVKAGGDTNIFVGKKEDIANLVGTTSDHRVARIGTILQETMDELIRARTGAAVTKQEEEFYTKILPSTGKTMNYNRAQAQALYDLARNDKHFIDEQIKQTVTSNARDFLFPPQMESDADFMERLNGSNVADFLPKQ